MTRKRYSRQFKITVAEEALLPKYKNCEHLIAAKYELREDTVRRWMEIYEMHGRAGFSKNAKLSLKDEQLLEAQQRIDELEEEVEVLKKAAAFLAKLNRD